MNRRLAAAALTATIALGGTALSAAETTLTGTVGDAMCGTKHMMAGKDEACTKGCVKKGSDYALVVGDKAYTLKATDAQKAELDKLAGKSAKIIGDLDGTTVKVTSIEAAK